MVTNEDPTKRITDCFHQDEPPPFVEFDDIDDHIVVHISPEYVSLYQALFEGGRNEAEARPGEDVNRVNIYLTGRNQPLEIDYMDDVDVADLNDDLNFAGSGESEFITFVDGDGETNCIRVDHIMVVETPEFEREGNE